jgi:hypothetical protein
MIVSSICRTHFRWIILNKTIVLDATKVTTNPDLANGTYDKVFSNAAMHVSLISLLASFHPWIN